MELSSEQNNSSAEKETSNISDFIGAEQGDYSKPTTDSKVGLVDNERNNKDELSRPLSEEQEPEEQTYQDILGSGDLLKKIIKQGAPDDRPMKGEQIVVNLVGRLEEKDDVIEEKKNLEITLGDCEVT